MASREHDLASPILTITENGKPPRFGGVVQGHGSSDPVPMALPEGTFVLNRNATRAMRRSYQARGTVMGSGSGQDATVVHVAVSIDLRNSTFGGKPDVRELVRLLTEHFERTMRSPHNQRRIFP